jgi:hypothetical protein
MSAETSAQTFINQANLLFKKTPNLLYWDASNINEYHIGLPKLIRDKNSELPSSLRRELVRDIEKYEKEAQKYQELTNRGLIYVGVDVSAKDRYSQGVFSVRRSIVQLLPPNSYQIVSDNLTIFENLCCLSQRFEFRS